MKIKDAIQQLQQYPSEADVFVKYEKPIQNNVIHIVKISDFEFEIELDCEKIYPLNENESLLDWLKKQDTYWHIEDEHEIMKNLSMPAPAIDVAHAIEKCKKKFVVLRSSVTADDDRMYVLQWENEQEEWLLAEYHKATQFMKECN